MCNCFTGIVAWSLDYLTWDDFFFYFHPFAYKFQIVIVFNQLSGSLLCTTSFFIHFSVEEHVDYFQFLAIMNKSCYEHR